MEELEEMLLEDILNDIDSFSLVGYLTHQRRKETYVIERYKKNWIQF
jgi:hypothetical protein